MTTIDHQEIILCPDRGWPLVSAQERKRQSRQMPGALLSDTQIAALYAGQRYENYKGREILSNVLPPRDPVQHMRRGASEGGEPGHYLTRGGS